MKKIILSILFILLIANSGFAQGYGQQGGITGLSVVGNNLVFGAPIDSVISEIPFSFESSISITTLIGTSFKIFNTAGDSMIFNPNGFSGANSAVAGTAVFNYKSRGGHSVIIDSLSAYISVYDSPVSNVALMQLGTDADADRFKVDEDGDVTNDGGITSGGAISGTDLTATTGDVSVGDDVLLADGAVVGITGNEVITFLAAGSINFTGATVDIDGAFTATSVTADNDVTATNDVIGDSLIGTTGLRTLGAEIASITHQTTNSSLTLLTNGTGDVLLDITAIAGVDGKIKLGDTGTESETMVVDSSGFVGIGVDDPVVALEVGNVSGTVTPGQPGSEDGTIGVGGVAIGRVYVEGSSQADMIFDDSGGGGNVKLMQLIMVDGVFRFRSLNDAGSVKVDPILGLMTTGEVGMGTISPGTALQIVGTDAYLTLQNSTAENGEGEAETRIIFEDHADAALAQIEGSHSGAADDTKGKIIISTHTGSALTTALTINDTQAIYAGLNGNEENYLNVEIFNDSTVTGETTWSSVLPAGFIIESIIFKNTTGNEITDLDIGFTDAGGEIVAAANLLANDEGSFTLLQRVDDFDAADDIFISADNFNSANIIIYIRMVRIF